jgi:type II secretory pathway component PulF
MNATLPDHSKLVRSITWIAFILLLIMSAVNIYVAFQLPKFHGLYYDLGVIRLPWYTDLLLHWRFIFDLLAFLWPMIGALIIRLCSNQTAMRVLLAFDMVAIIQIGLTFYTLVRPLHYPYSPFV